MHPQMQQARKMELTSMLIVALEKINWTDTSKKEALEEALFNLIIDAHNETVNGTDQEDENPDINEQQIIS